MDAATHARDIALAREAAIACSEASFKSREELQEEKLKCRELTRKLEQLPFLVKNQLVVVFSLATEELAQTNPYPVYKDEDTSKWVVSTAICQYGGCEMGLCEFPSERDAFLFAAALKAVNFNTIPSICPSCREEYNNL